MAYATFNDLVNAIIQTESSGRANARGKAGELGLMQIQPNTAERYGIKDPRMLLDPTINRAVGARILGDLLKRYKGNVGLALDAYNAGEGKADKGVVSPSTRDYIGKVLSKLGGAIGPASADAAEFAPVKDRAQAKRMGAMGGIGMVPMVGATQELDPRTLEELATWGRSGQSKNTALDILRDVDKGKIKLGDLMGAIRTRLLSNPKEADSIRRAMRPQGPMSSLMPQTGGIDEVPLLLRRALNEGRLTSDAATGLNRAARAGLLGPDHVREILKMADPQAAPAATGSKTPGMFVDEGAGTRAMRLVGQGAGALGVARKVGEQFGEDIKSGLKRAGGAIGNAAQGLLEGTAEAAEPTGSVKELPSVYGRAEGVPIPKGASIGNPSATVPIPAGASIGKPPAKTAAPLPLPLPVRIADFLPLVGQIGGEMGGAALGGGPEDIPAVGIGGGLGEGTGEELQTGIRALYGQPHKTQAEILKDAGISGAVSTAGVPVGKALGKVGEVIAPSSLKAALAARGAYRASRDALEATMKKLSDLLGLDAKAAAAAAASPIERRDVQAAYMGARQAGFEKLGEVYRDILGPFLHRMTPNQSATAYSDFSNKYGARSLSLLDGGVDFTRPTVRMIQVFRGNIRKMIRQANPQEERQLLADLFKLDRAATKDIKAVLPVDQARRLDLIDRTYADYVSQVPARQVRAIMRAPNAPKAMEAIIKGEPSQVATLLRQVDGMSGPERAKALTALKKATGEWIHDQASTAKDYVGQLNAYAKALSDVPDVAFNRLYGPGTKATMRRAVEATIEFHRKMLAHPDMIAAIQAEMKAKPLPWIVRHARWVSFGALYGLAEGDLTKAGAALAIGLTPDVMHVLLNNAAAQKLYLKAVTAQSPAAIAAGFRALLTALASEQIRGPIKDPDELAASPAP